MAVTVPNPLTGRFVARLKLIVQTVASNGSLTPAGGASDVASLQDSTGDPYAGSPTDLTFSVSILAELDFGQGTTNEDISSIDRPVENNVRIGSGPRLTVTEILRSSTDSTRLAAIWHNGVSRYVSYEFARGGNYWTCYGLMTRYSEDGAKGKNSAPMTIVPVGIAPTYSTGVRSS